MVRGEKTCPETAVSLISGEHNAVLIDAVITPANAGRVYDHIETRTPS